MDLIGGGKDQLIEVNFKILDRGLREYNFKVYNTIHDTNVRK